MCTVGVAVVDAVDPAVAAAPVAAAREMAHGDAAAAVAADAATALVAADAAAGAQLSLAGDRDLVGLVGLQHVALDRALDRREARL